MSGNFRIEHVDYSKLKEAFIEAALCRLPQEIASRPDAQIALRQWRASANFFYDVFVEFLHNTGYEISHCSKTIM